MFFVLFNQLCIQRRCVWYLLPNNPEMCSKLPATVALFSVLSLWVHPRTIKVSLPLLMLFTWLKIPGSPHLHNFNVHVPNCESLGTRLSSMYFTSLSSCPQEEDTKYVNQPTTQPTTQPTKLPSATSAPTENVTETSNGTASTNHEVSSNAKRDIRLFPRGDPIPGQTKGVSFLFCDQRTVEAGWDLGLRVT